MNDAKHDIWIFASPIIDAGYATASSVTKVYIQYVTTSMAIDQL